MHPKLTSTTHHSDKTPEQRSPTYFCYFLFDAITASRFIAFPRHWAWSSQPSFPASHLPSLHRPSWLPELCYFIWASPPPFNKFQLRPSKSVLLTLDAKECLALQQDRLHNRWNNASDMKVFGLNGSHGKVIFQATHTYCHMQPCTAIVLKLLHKEWGSAGKSQGLQGVKSCAATPGVSKFSPFSQRLLNTHFLILSSHSLTLLWYDNA